MPGMISQRSVGRLQRLLQRLFIRPPQTIPLLSWAEFRTQLYEQDVDHRILDHLERLYSQNPSRFLPAIHDGTIPANILRDWGGKPESWDRGKGQELLKVIAEVALRRGLSLPPHLPEVIAIARELQASLELDGYAFIA